MNELPYQVRKWRDPLRCGDLKEMSAPRVWHIGNMEAPDCGNTARNTEHATWSSYMVKCFALFVFAEA